MLVAPVMDNCYKEVKHAINSERLTVYKHALPHCIFLSLLSSSSDIYRAIKYKILTICGEIFYAAHVFQGVTYTSNQQHVIKYKGNPKIKHKKSTYQIKIRSQIQPK